MGDGEARSDGGLEKGGIAGLKGPYRGDGYGRPTHIPLPPDRMPLLWAGRLRKQWRYVSIWSERVLACAASIEVGPVRQEFWAVWDRETRQMWERTRLYPKAVALPPGRVLVTERDARIDVALDENTGFQVVTPSGGAYTWTRKQLVPVRGAATVAGRRLDIEGVALIDDNAGYHPRRTRWQWSGGAGRTTDGRQVAWSVIVGLNDSPHNSERTLWIDGEAREVGPVTFAADLSAIDFDDGSRVTFTQEAVRARSDNLLLIRSRYSQPFGAFSGTLPGGLELAEGHGVMEWHDAMW